MPERYQRLKISLLQQEISLICLILMGNKQLLLFTWSRLYAKNIGVSAYFLKPSSRL